MMNRIRYVKRDEGLVSKNILVSKSTGAKYLVYINLKDMTYVIRNQVSLRKYVGGDDINNLNVLKRAVRKHLSQLGVELESEKRMRTFGRCSTGWNQDKQLKKQNTHP